MFARKPHYELPADLTGTTLTLLLQQPLKLHDMQVVHITVEREALSQWLDKGGEIRGKLNGIGFAQPLTMEVDSSQHLVIRDVSLQGSRLALPGTASDSVPEEIKQQLAPWIPNGTSSTPALASSKKCLFIHSDWLGRIEASLQDVSAQIKQARQC